MKAKDVRGFMVEYKDLNGMIKIFGPGTMDVGIGCGHNYALDQQGNREISFNRERLAKVLLLGHEDIYSKRVVDKMVDAIIAAEAYIIESPKDDK